MFNWKLKIFKFYTYDFITQWVIGIKILGIAVIIGTSEFNNKIINLKYINY